MIITIGGEPGAGKSTVSKLLAKKLGYQHYYAGRLYREMAEKEGLTPLAFKERVRTDPHIDQEIDRRFIDLAEHGTRYIMEGWVAFHFIPTSYKVNLVASENERARRVFESIRPLEQENTSLEKTKENNAQRYKNSLENFLKKYKVDISSRGNYDQTIDTTCITPEEVVEKILTNKKYLAMKRTQICRSSGHPNV